MDNARFVYRLQSRLYINGVIRLFIYNVVVKAVIVLGHLTKCHVM